MLVAGSQQFLPYREWVLTNVFIENMADSATAFSPLGTVGLTLNPGSATPTLINYDAAGKAVSASRSIDFVTPPTSTVPVETTTAISTEVDRCIQSRQSIYGSGSDIHIALHLNGGQRSECVYVSFRQRCEPTCPGLQSWPKRLRRGSG